MYKMNFKTCRNQAVSDRGRAANCHFERSEKSFPSGRKISPHSVRRNDRGGDVRRNDRAGAFVKMPRLTVGRGYDPMPAV